MRRCSLNCGDQSLNDAQKRHARGSYLKPIENGSSLIVTHDPISCYVTWEARAASGVTWHREATLSRIHLCTHCERCHGEGVPRLLVKLILEQKKVWYPSKPFLKRWSVRRPRQPGTERAYNHVWLSVVLISYYTQGSHWCHCQVPAYYLRVERCKDHDGC